MITSPIKIEPNEPQGLQHIGGAVDRLVAQYLNHRENTLTQRQTEPVGTKRDSTVTQTTLVQTQLF